MGSKTPSDNSPPPPPRPQVKKENEEEIKEFAETAMNELLGWYGYERLELRRWAATQARDTSSPEQNEQKNKDECSWCNKSITSESRTIQHGGATFCCELCFCQSRRANFKRAKTCDWCRHVRHTVAYVDFQEGATQLQFCSDKCLNQYKMHIFCRETQAHLDLNPHLVNASSSSSLITPELWLKNCKSRSVSPNSERSGSPEKEHTEKRKSPLPQITVAPTAKLMKPKTNEDPPIQKSPETKKDVRSTKALRKRRTSKCSATVTSQSLRQHASTPKAQDLRMCSPSEGSSPASTIGPSVVHSPPQTINPHLPPPPFGNTVFGMPPPFMDPHHVHDLRHPGMFPPRFLPRPNMHFHDRSRLPPPLNFPAPPQMGQVPPVTVLVPYPVVLPIPFPVPIPLPLTSFIQAQCVNKVKKEVNTDDSEGPLDFTMNGDKNKDEEPKPQSDTEIIIPLDKNRPADEINEVNDRINDNDKKDDVTERNPEQTLPKFKITRLGNKLAKIVTKPKEPSESTRPLRKRRRLVEAAEDDALIPKTRKIVQV